MQTHMAYSLKLRFLLILNSSYEKLTYLQVVVASWMLAFNVTDQEGNKITDGEVIDYIHKSLGPDSTSRNKSIDFQSTSEYYTSIEFIERDMPGLLSELSVVLAHLGCNVINVKIWTHNTIQEKRLSIDELDI